MSASLRPSYGWLLAGVLAAAVAATFLVRDRLDLVALENAVRGLGAWGAVAFALIFAAATVLFLPGSAFGLAGGALFGPVLGTVINLAGGTLGATRPSWWPAISLAIGSHDALAGGSSRS
jgi:uncharacterized membrane protein YdjX (TVP38/TMEM64 family)